LKPEFRVLKKPVKTHDGGPKKLPSKSRHDATESIVITSNFDLFKEIRILTGYISEDS